MIEPNIHPVFVHFSYALSITAFIAYALAAFPPSTKWRETLRPAADWMLAFAALAIIATIAAGFQAYYSVAHDGPSHAAMTTHRNFAVPSGMAILLLALWRWRARAKTPSAMFVAIFAAAALSLSVTAWWGGKIVYGYGLGVKALPQSTGEGHDHEHGAGEEHAPDATDDTSAATDDGHDHEHPDEATDAAAETMTAMDHDAMPGMSENAPSSGAYPETSVAVIDAFSAALRAGDAAMVERLLLPEVFIAESGGAERSYTEYAGHHLPADMAFTKAVSFTLKDRKVIEAADMATIVSTSQVHGEFDGKKIHSASMETAVLKREGGQWRIAHIHWSSAPITGDHEH